MKIFYWEEIKNDLNNGRLIPFFKQGCGISIGSFDGLHQGHRVLLSNLIDNCKSNNLLSGVISFTRPLPSLKHASDYQGDLTTLNQRLKLFEKAGLDFAIIVNFDESFAALSGVQFLTLLVNSCNMKFIAEGVDFRCGYKGATDITAIKYFADSKNIKYNFVEPVYYRQGTNEQERISSSYIRTMVLKRFLSTVQELLLRPYSLELKFETEKTVLLKSEIKQVLPPNGVYSVEVKGKKVRLKITEKELQFQFIDGFDKTLLNELVEVVL